MMMSALKRKNTSLSIDQKVEILNYLQSKSKKRKELSLQYGIDLSTIARIVQQERKIRNVAIGNLNTARKRLRKGNYEQLDLAVAIWYRQMRSNNVFIDGPMVREAARKFAAELDVRAFEPSNGWLSRWKTKEHVSFQKKVQSEKSTSSYNATEWMSNTLANLLLQYEPMNIYNADESGLFYNALPSDGRTLTASDSNALQCGKTPDDRLTLLFLCNMDGSDKRVFSVGRSKQPRGRQMPIPYYTNPKCWMTISLWTKILLEFDRSMGIQKRKVLVFVGDAPCHKLEDGVALNNVKVQFLPANTTSSIQPLEQGIIRTFKVHYRQMILQRRLLALEKGLSLVQFVKTIDVLESLKMVKKSWLLVKSSTIRHCFQKSGFLKLDSGSEEDGGVEVSSVTLSIPENEFNDFVECDARLDCYGELTVEEILDAVKNHERNDDEEEKEEDEVKIPPSHQDARVAITVLRSYFEYHRVDQNNLDALQSQLYNISAPNSTANIVCKKICGKATFTRDRILCTPDVTDI